MQYFWVRTSPLSWVHTKCQGFQYWEWLLNNIRASGKRPWFIATWLTLIVSKPARLIRHSGNYSYWLLVSFASYDHYYSLSPSSFLITIGPAYNCLLKAWPPITGRFPPGTSPLLRSATQLQTHAPSLLPPIHLHQVLLNHLTSKHHQQLNCRQLLPTFGSLLISRGILSASNTRTLVSAKMNQGGW